MPKSSQHVLTNVKDVEGASPGPGNIRREYRIKGAPGLQLRVGANARKTWVVAYKSPRTSKWAKVALGHWPAIGSPRPREEQGT